MPDRIVEPFKPYSRLVTATSTKTGSVVTALVDGIPTNIEVARDLTVAIGDVLLVVRYGSQWFALGRGYASAPASTADNDPPPDPKPAVVYGVITFAPVSTGTWNGTAWRTDNDDLYQGIYGASGNHIGAAFYGSKPSTLAGATILSATAAVRRPQRGAGYGTPQTTLQLITETERPAGAPTLTSSTPGPALAVNATDTAFSIPIAWVQAMVNGTAGGIGLYDADGSPFTLLAGRGTWGPAFTITAEWSR